MELYLATGPEGLETALAATGHIAHAVGRIGEVSTLLLRPLPEALRGGLVLLSNQGAPRVEAPEKLVQALVRLCRERHFAGVVLDFEGAARPDLGKLAAMLEGRLRRENLRLYVPEEYAGSVERAAVVVCTALSGGFLEERLKEAVERFGAGRVALDLQRLRMDFPLPCPSGEGEALSGEELEKRIAGQAVHFSVPLCARYVVLLRQGRGRLVLFDDEDTMAKKIALAEGLGIRQGFVMLPEVADLLPQLFGGQKEKS